MRWIVLLILAYLALAAQNVLGILVCIRTESMGRIAPDILAAMAVFFALSVRNIQDVTIACWVLGIGLDLTTAGGAGQPSVVGPMALSYCVAGWMVFKFRDVFFRDRVSSQIILSVLFALVAHGIWVTLQTVIVARSAHWELYGRMLLQACLLALYSGLLAPLVFALLRRCERWLINPAAGRGTRER